MKTYLRSIWLTGFLVSAVALAGTACGSDDDDDDNGTGGTAGTGGGNTGGKGGTGGGNTGGKGGTGGSGNTGGSSGSGGSSGTGGATGGAGGDDTGGAAGTSGGAGSGGDAGAAGGGATLAEIQARCATDFDMLGTDFYSNADFCTLYNDTCDPASATECESFAAPAANKGCRSYHLCNAFRMAPPDVATHCGHANGAAPCADM